MPLLPFPSALSFLGAKTQSRGGTPITKVQNAVVCTIPRATSVDVVLAQTGVLCPQLLFLQSSKDKEPTLQRADSFSLGCQQNSVTPSQVPKEEKGPISAPSQQWKKASNLASEGQLYLLPLTQPGKSASRRSASVHGPSPHLCTFTRNPSPR